jgi:hypothetical protein
LYVIVSQGIPDSESGNRLSSKANTKLCGSINPIFTNSGKLVKDFLHSDEIRVKKRKAEPKLCPSGCQKK